MFFIVLGLAFVAAVALRVSTADVRLVSQTAIDSTTGSRASEPATSVGASTEDPGQIAETGTLVSVAPDGTELGTVAATGTMSSREQRYQELLRSSPPAPVAVPIQQPEEKPSLIQRAMNAIGLGEEKPKRPTTPPPGQPRPGPQQQAQNQNQQPNQPKPNDPKNEPKQPAEESDADSDTLAPQLVALEFAPPQVQDGESTQLAITAQDDRSGIRTISGVIANPAGVTVNGFAAAREGDSNRYVARIVVPKDAAEGNWHIKYLTMADNASNSVNLAYGQGLAPAMASFRVTSSRSDSQGPRLVDVRVERRGMSAGEKNTVFVMAEDDKAGVQLVSGVFVSPNKLARLGFGCRAGAGGTTWECTLNVPECIDCGIWQLEQVQLQDKANNTTTVRVDNDMIKQIQVDVSGQKCDGAAPVLTMLQLNPLVVSNAELSYVQVTATVQDDNCGGATLSGLVTGPSGNRLNIIFDPSKDGQHFTGKIEVRPNTPSGTYTVAWIQALDKGQNLRAYSANEPVVGQVSFKIE